MVCCKLPSTQWFDGLADADLSCSGVAAVAVNGATNFIPELNSWLQLVEMNTTVGYPFLATICTLADVCHAI